MFQGPNITYHLLCTNTKAGSFDCPPFSVSKKSVTFLHAKNATFFVKLTLHEKSRFARQKA